MRASVIVDGIGDLRDALGMVLLDGWSDTPPEPRLRLVEVPGRSGSLDLTDALGGPFFGDRKLSFSFLVRDRDYGAARARVTSALHGRRLRFTLTADPEHTYVGRWSATGYEWRPPDATVISYEVVADPYRYGKDRSVRLDATGGRLVTLTCGDLPSSLTVGCDAPVRVEIRGEAHRAPAGRRVLAGAWLEPGDNELWVVSGESRATRWDYFGEGGSHPVTWDGASSMRWDELARLAGDDGLAERKWSEVGGMPWGDVARLDWRGVLYRLAPSGDEAFDPVVTFEWEWRDL